MCAWWSRSWGGAGQWWCGARCSCKGRTKGLGGFRAVLGPGHWELGMATGAVLGVKLSLRLQKLENLHGEGRRWDVRGFNEGAQLTAVGSCLPVHPAGHRMGLHWSNWAGVGGKTGEASLSSERDQSGPPNPSTGQPQPCGPGGVCRCLGGGFGARLPRGPTQQHTATRGYYSACTCQVSSGPP